MIGKWIYLSFIYGFPLFASPAPEVVAVSSSPLRPNSAPLHTLQMVAYRDHCCCVESLAQKISESFVRKLTTRKKGLAAIAKGPERRKPKVKSNAVVVEFQANGGLPLRRWQVAARFSGDSYDNGFNVEIGFSGRCYHHVKTTMTRSSWSYSAARTIGENFRGAIAVISRSP